MYTHMHACTHTHTRTCVHTHTCTHNMHACTHTHTVSQLDSLKRWELQLRKGDYSEFLLQVDYSEWICYRWITVSGFVTDRLQWVDLLQMDYSEWICYRCITVSGFVTDPGWRLCQPSQPWGGWSHLSAGAWRKSASLSACVASCLYVCLSVCVHVAGC